MGKNLIRIYLLSSLNLIFIYNLNALTLKESVSEVLQTNPVVQERLKNFYETQQDLNIAQSEYLPSLDYVSKYGVNQAGRLKNEVEDITYNHYTNSLKLTQNIFNGYSTTHKIDYEKARILAAAHNYVENANDIAFQMVGAYLDLIRSYKLLQNSKENVDINEKIYNDVQSLYDNGLTTKSEMTKIFASLSLARSNYLVQENNAKEKSYAFKRLLGREANVATFTLPKLDLPMPESLERATMYAIKNNPSILVSNYNIQGAQALYKQKQSAYYPIVNVEVEQVLNDVDKTNSFDSPDDRLSAYLTLSWNLFNGGADKANIQKSRSTINKEVEIQRDLKRQTIEGIELSWSAYKMITNQLNELYKYNSYSKETLESYSSEYELGRRTLLDLLSAQNDLIGSKSEIINAQIDKLYAQYRILDAMGLLVDTILGGDATYKKVIEPTSKPFAIVTDSLPVSYDVDNDKVVDELDICDNSVAGDNIKPYGCVQNEKDSDLDGVSDDNDMCPKTEFGDKVDEKGCKSENSENKFAIDDESYVNDAKAYDETSPKKSQKLGLYDYEYSADKSKNVKSTDLDNHLMYGEFELIRRYDAINMDKFSVSSANDTIDDIVKDVKKYEDKNITLSVIGNTKKEDNKDASFEEASKYASSIKHILELKGVKANIIVPNSRADYEKLYLATNIGESSLNNRVFVSLYVPKDSKKGVEKPEESITPIQKPQEEQNTDGDDDKDGVLNSVDECPDTPSGYIVENNGCSKKINLEVLFENNSSYIKTDSTQKIDEFKKYLEEFPQYNIKITGHSSKAGRADEKYNEWLSLRRADSVKNYLVSQGIEANRIETVGKGYSEPIASNDTQEGQAQNRRIIAELIDNTVK